MSNFKRELIALIENIPDEQTDLLEKILRDIRARLDDDSPRHEDLYERAELSLAHMEDIESLTREGGDSAHG